MLSLTQSLTALEESYSFLLVFKTNLWWAWQLILVGGGWMNKGFVIAYVFVDMQETFFPSVGMNNKRLFRTTLKCSFRTQVYAYR